MSADEIVWEDPPPTVRGGSNAGQGHWFRFIEELQRHPGKWAVARSGMEGYQPATKLQVRLKRGGCDATIRRQSDGTITIYARWPEGTS